MEVASVEKDGICLPYLSIKFDLEREPEFLVSGLKPEDTTPVTGPPENALIW